MNRAIGQDDPITDCSGRDYFARNSFDQLCESKMPKIVETIPISQKMSHSNKLSLFANILDYSLVRGIIWNYLTPFVNSTAKIFNAAISALTSTN